MGRAFAGAAALNFLVGAIAIEVLPVFVHLLAPTHTIELFYLLRKLGEAFVLVLLLLPLGALIVLQLSFLLDLMAKVLPVLVLHRCHPPAPLLFLLSGLLLPLRKLHADVRIYSRVALPKRRDIVLCVLLLSGHKHLVVLNIDSKTYVLVTELLEFLHLLKLLQAVVVLLLLLLVAISLDLSLTILLGEHCIQLLLVELPNEARIRLLSMLLATDTAVLARSP